MLAQNELFRLKFFTQALFYRSKFIDNYSKLYVEWYCANKYFIAYAEIYKEGNYHALRFSEKFTNINACRESEKFVMETNVVHYKGNGLVPDKSRYNPDLYAQVYTICYYAAVNAQQTVAATTDINLVR